MPSTNRTVLQLGSNKGNKLEYLKNAINGISEFSTIVKEGSVYLTEAWGNTDQGDFYNQIIEIETQLDPFSLMEKLLEVEKNLGRVRTDKWGPRIIDIDILFYDQKRIKTKNLEIPHPRLHQRKFVLQPLLEYWSKWEHPIFFKTVDELYYFCKDSLEVKRIDLE